MSVAPVSPPLSALRTALDLQKIRGSLPPLIPSVGLAGAIALGSLVALPLAASASPQTWTVTSVASVSESAQHVASAHASRSSTRKAVKRTAVKPVVRMQQVTRDVAVGASESGQASWYGGAWAGRTTASGEVFRPSEMTAAHKFLAFGTRLRVCTQWSCVIVRVTDRGPYVAGRIIDLSEGAAGRVGILGSGVGYVTITPIQTRTFMEPIKAPVKAVTKAKPARASRSHRGEVMPHGVGYPVAPKAVVQPDLRTQTSPALALAPLSVLGAVAGLRGRARVMMAELPEGEPAIA